MKTWHYLALGVAAFAVARAVNTYRATHYAANRTNSIIEWEEGLLAIVGVYKFPHVMSAPGGTVSLLTLPTPQPSAGMSGLPSTPDFMNTDGTPGYFLR